MIVVRRPDGTELTPQQVAALQAALTRYLATTTAKKYVRAAAAPLLAPNNSRT